MTTINCRALVIHLNDYGEADKIIHLLTPDHGRITCIAKGAKRSKKRFINKLEYCSHLAIEAAPGTRSTLLRLDQAELINPFIGIRENFQAYTAAMLLCESVRYLTRDHDPDEKLFILLLWSFIALEEGHPTLAVIIIFQMKMFEILGYRPQLDACINCGESTEGLSMSYFSPAHCGLLCNQCRTGTGLRLISLSINTIKTLQLTQNMGLDKVKRLRFPENCTQEAINLLKEYGAYIGQREIQSWELITALSPAPATRRPSCPSPRP